MNTFSNVVLVCLAFCPCFALGQEEIPQPNIIVVMSDDHGQWALGAYGLKHIDTPNLDWLADRGVLSPADIFVQLGAEMGVKNREQALAPTSTSIGVFAGAALFD